LASTNSLGMFNNIEPTPTDADCLPMQV